MNLYLVPVMGIGVGMLMVLGALLWSEVRREGRFSLGVSVSLTSGISVLHLGLADVLKAFQISNLWAWGITAAWAAGALVLVVLVTRSVTFVRVTK